MLSACLTIDLWLFTKNMNTLQMAEAKRQKMYSSHSKKGRLQEMRAILHGQRCLAIGIRNLALHSVSAGYIQCPN